MPDLDDQPQLETQVQADLQAHQDLVGTAQELSQLLGEVMQGLADSLSGVPGVDNQALNSAQETVDAQRAALDGAAGTLSQTSPAAEDSELAKKIDDALNQKGDLKDLREELGRLSEQNRDLAARSHVDINASDQTIARQMDQRDRAQNRQEWADQAAETARLAENVRNTTEQIRSIQQDLQQNGSIEDALRELSRVTREIAARADPDDKDRLRRMWDRETRGEHGPSSE